MSAALDSVRLTQGSGISERAGDCEHTLPDLDQFGDDCDSLWKGNGRHG